MEFSAPNRHDFQRCGSNTFKRCDVCFSLWPSTDGVISKYHRCGSCGLIIHTGCKSIAAKCIPCPGNVPRNDGSSEPLRDHVVIHPSVTRGGTLFIRMQHCHDITVFAGASVYGKVHVTTRSGDRQFTTEHASCGTEECVWNFASSLEEAMHQSNKNVDITGAAAFYLSAQDISYMEREAAVRCHISAWRSLLGGFFDSEVASGTINLLPLFQFPSEVVDRWFTVENLEPLPSSQLTSGRVLLQLLFVPAHPIASRDQQTRSYSTTLNVETVDISLPRSALHPESTSTQASDMTSVSDREGTPEPPSADKLLDLSPRNTTAAQLSVVDGKPDSMAAGLAVPAAAEERPLVQDSVLDASVDGRTEEWASFDEEEAIESVESSDDDMNEVLPNNAGVRFAANADLDDRENEAGSGDEDSKSIEEMLGNEEEINGMQGSSVLVRRKQTNVEALLTEVTPQMMVQSIYSFFSDVSPFTTSNPVVPSPDSPGSSRGQSTFSDSSTHSSETMSATSAGATSIHSFDIDGDSIHNTVYSEGHRSPQLPQLPPLIQSSSLQQDDQNFGGIYPGFGNRFSAVIREPVHAHAGVGTFYVNLLSVYKSNVADAADGDHYVIVSLEGATRTNEKAKIVRSKLQRSLDAGEPDYSAGTFSTERTDISSSGSEGGGVLIKELKTHAVFSSASPIFNVFWCVQAEHYRAKLNFYLMDANTHKRIAQSAVYFTPYSIMHRDAEYLDSYASLLQFNQAGKDKTRPPAVQSSRSNADRVLKLPMIRVATGKKQKPTNTLQSNISDVIDFAIPARADKFGHSSSNDSVGRSESRDPRCSAIGSVIGGLADSTWETSDVMGHFSVKIGFEEDVSGLFLGKSDGGNPSIKTATNPTVVREKKCSFPTLSDVEELEHEVVGVRNENEISSGIHLASSSPDEPLSVERLSMHIQRFKNLIDWICAVYEEYLDIMSWRDSKFTFALFLAFLYWTVYVKSEYFLTGPVFVLLVLLTRSGWRRRYGIYRKCYVEDRYVQDFVQQMASSGSSTTGTDISLARILAPYLNGNVYRPIAMLKLSVLGFRRVVDESVLTSRGENFSSYSDKVGEIHPSIIASYLPMVAPPKGNTTSSKDGNEETTQDALKGCYRQEYVIGRLGGGRSPMNITAANMGNRLQPNVSARENVHSVRRASGVVVDADGISSYDDVRDGSMHSDRSSGANSAIIETALPHSVDMYSSYSSEKMSITSLFTVADRQNQEKEQISHLNVGGDRRRRGLVNMAAANLMAGHRYSSRMDGDLTTVSSMFNQLSSIVGIESGSNPVGEKDDHLKNVNDVWELNQKGLFEYLRNQLMWNSPRNGAARRKVVACAACAIPELCLLYPILQPISSCALPFLEDRFKRKSKNLKNLIHRLKDLKRAQQRLKLADSSEGTREALARKAAMKNMLQRVVKAEYSVLQELKATMAQSDKQFYLPWSESLDTVKLTIYLPNESDWTRPCASADTVDHSSRAGTKPSRFPNELFTAELHVKDILNDNAARKIFDERGKNIPESVLNAPEFASIKQSSSNGGKGGTVEPRGLQQEFAMWIGAGDSQEGPSQVVGSAIGASAAGEVEVLVRVQLDIRDEVRSGFQAIPATTRNNIARLDSSRSYIHTDGRVGNESCFADTHDASIALQESLLNVPGKLADNGTISVIWNLTDNIKFVQNWMAWLLDQIESSKNIFNWTSPSKTFPIYLCLVGLWLITLAIPGRLILLAVGMYEFLYVFLPMPKNGTFGSKFCNFLQSVPNDDDLAQIYTLDRHVYAAQLHVAGAQVLRQAKLSLSNLNARTDHPSIRSVLAQDRIGRFGGRIPACVPAAQWQGIVGLKISGLSLQTSGITCHKSAAFNLLSLSSQQSATSSMGTSSGDSFDYSGGISANGVGNTVGRSVIDEDDDGERLPVRFFPEFIEVFLVLQGVRLAWWAYETDLDSGKGPAGQLLLFGPAGVTDPSPVDAKQFGTQRLLSVVGRDFIGKPQKISIVCRNADTKMALADAVEHTLNGSQIE